jgi:hypothetical protein
MGAEVADMVVGCDAGLWLAEGMTLEPCRGSFATWGANDSRVTLAPATAIPAL